jgi:hypothetical protein
MTNRTNPLRGRGAGSDDGAEARRLSPGLSPSGCGRSVSASFNGAEPTDGPVHSRPCDQPSAPTSDRRHEHAPVLANDAAQLHSRRLDIDHHRPGADGPGRFATFLRRSPDTATADDVRRLHVARKSRWRPFFGSRFFVGLLVFVGPRVFVGPSFVAPPPWWWSPPPPWWGWAPPPW